MMGPAISDAELERVLAWYGLTARDGAPTARVVTARVLRVAVVDGELAIKVFGREQHARARAEAALLAHLGAGGGDGYRVQRLVRTVAGEELLALDDRRVLVTRWEHGSHRGYQEIDATGWAVLGRTLAALHRSLDDAPPIGLPSVVDEIRERDIDRDREILEDHRRRARESHAAGAVVALRLLDDRAILLERHANRCQSALPDGEIAPIHNDYNVHNFLFDHEGAPTPTPTPVVLDWERAARAPRELEVIRCLSHLPWVAPASAWAFVDGYLERRALDPERIAWSVDASIRAHALKHWPVELWLDGAPGAVERLAGNAEIVCALVEGQHRLEAFIDALRTRITRGSTP
jgi:Ser/Thr protein kinase RdoA (MazF antagonist)